MADQDVQAMWIALCETEDELYACVSRLRALQAAQYALYMGAVRASAMRIVRLGGEHGVTRSQLLDVVRPQPFFPERWSVKTVIMVMVEEGDLVTTKEKRLNSAGAEQNQIVYRIGERAE